MRSNTKEAKEIVDFADDVRALLEATADVTGQKVERARKRLEVAFERGKANGEDLIDESVDISAENVQKLRDIFAGTLNHGKEIYDKVQDDVVSRAKAADHAVRKNPYITLGIALGVGAIAGFVLSCRHARNKQNDLHGNSHE